MADLTYNDVQRAVQDAIRSVQNDTQRLVNDSSSIAQQVQLIDDISRDVQDIHRAISNMQTQMDQIARGVNDENDDQRVVTLQNDIHELKTRFSTIERFAQQMSNYMQTRYQEEEEDRAYRRT
ncbi:MAG TPA: hypothetical protein VD907_00785 [Verrucomicrobiae bacterium]|nr:hypothetical protein [Verrucomicrobiae bacterium]